MLDGVDGIEVLEGGESLEHCDPLDPLQFKPHTRPESLRVPGNRSQAMMTGAAD